jgi:hypothetical protein
VLREGHIGKLFADAGQLAYISAAFLKRTEAAPRIRQAKERAFQSWQFKKRTNVDRSLFRQPMIKAIL